jgi:protoporphyrinogen oxidase
MRIAVIGAGITGLTAALKLSQKGHQVVVFEKEKYPGGLVAGFRQKNWPWSLEYFFHHLFTSDIAAKNLIAELGLTDKLFYSHPKTSIYFKGQISQFDSPFSLLKFPHLSFPQKIRAGVISVYLKLTPDWQTLEKIKATQWLKKFYGQKTYQILWEPLLKAKFGEFFNQIPASWFWARIKKRSSKLGYLEGGFQVLIDKIVEEIKKNKGELTLGKEIKDIQINNSQLSIINYQFDKVVFTTPTETFLKIMGNKLPEDYRQKLKQLKMIGVLNLVLTLKESFLKDDTYWLNVNDNSFPFVAVVEHTNFVNKAYYGNHQILYVGGYYPQNHRYFKMSKEAILKEWLPYLQKINPDFNPLFNSEGIPRSGLINYSLFINLQAQPIVPLNYSKFIPSYQTPVKNVFLACMQQIYPWDRGANYAIEEGEKIAQLVNQ